MEWTPEKIEFLKEYYPKEGSEFVADRLGTTRKAVRTKAKSLKIKSKIDLKRFKWKEEYDSYLIKNYPNTRIDKMMAELGCSKSCIYQRAHRLGLRKTEEFTHSPESGVYFTKGSNIGKEFRFKKGHIPSNKGKKMPDEVKEKCKHTFFQKGHKPHNTKYNGAITTRKDSNGLFYKWIRISECEWKMLQVHLWEQKNGPIPKDKIIVAKNGNQLNCDPDNWMLIDRKEHLERNSGRKTLEDKFVARMIFPRDKHMREKVLESPELLELKRNELKLRHEIDGRNKQTK